METPDNKLQNAGDAYAVALVDGKETPGKIAPSSSLVHSDVVETPQQFEDRKRALGDYRPLFRTEEDFELFTMLPISREQRRGLIGKMLQAQAGGEKV